MPDVIHRWEMSERLERLVNQCGGFRGVVRAVPWHTPNEWGEQFRCDLERLGLRGRTRNAIGLWTAFAVAEWKYDASTERWHRPPASSNYHSDSFQVAGKLISFDQWCNALVHGEIPSSNLLCIRNFGSKSLEELMEAITRMYSSNLTDART